MKPPGLFLILMLVLAGCTKDNVDTASEISTSDTALMDKASASVYLTETLESYRDIPFDELAKEVGIGDHYSIVAESIDDHRTQGYSVSLEFDWENEARTSIFLTGTIYGPNPEEGGPIPELQTKSIVIRKH